MLMPMTLAGKTIVISGGSGGIGLALVRQLCARGNTVYSFDLHPLPADIPNAHGIVANIADWEQISQGMAGIPGTIDILINNAGVMHRGEYFQTTQAQWNTLVGVHLTGSYGMVREAHARFSAKPLIVQISSRHALHPKKDPFAYSLVKQAATTFAADLAQHYPHYVVQSVFAGPVETPLSYADCTPEQAAAKKIEQRADHPDQLAALIIQLMESEKSALVFDEERRAYDIV